MNIENSLYLNEAGIMATDLGFYNKAIEYCERALAIGKMYHDEKYSDIATYHNNPGLAYDNKGEFDKAMMYYRQSLIIFNKFLPVKHPSILTVQENVRFAQAAVTNK